jgi:hypothetical protein
MTWGASLLCSWAWVQTAGVSPTNKATADFPIPNSQPSFFTAHYVRHGDGHRFRSTASSRVANVVPVASVVAVVAVVLSGALHPLRLAVKHQHPISNLPTLASLKALGSRLEHHRGDSAPSQLP